ncbi:hypothetical protein ACIP9H_33545 [Streptomyces sp. NPDC088732]|uniref:hypothetical protein n=1 Tax=Streptomyces sp. NPDC088732 TaxID=3365879 RepID=UPI0038177AAF
MDTAAPAGARAIDEALMRFPYGQWIEMPDAARHVREQGLPGKVLTTVVRTGRRRGVLLVRRTEGASLVKRIHLGPYRPGAASAL